MQETNPSHCSNNVEEPETIGCSDLSWCGEQHVFLVRF